MLRIDFHFCLTSSDWRVIMAKWFLWGLCSVLSARNTWEGSETAFGMIGGEKSRPIAARGCALGWYSIFEYHPDHSAPYRPYHLLSLCCWRDMLLNRRGCNEGAADNVFLCALLLYLHLRANTFSSA